jgi:hypothetical protein
MTAFEGRLQPRSHIFSWALAKADRAKIMCRLEGGATKCRGCGFAALRMTTGGESGVNFVAARKLDFVDAAKLLLLGHVRGEEMTFAARR